MNRACARGRQKNEFGLTGYEFDDKKIVVTINQKTYDKFEEKAEKFGLTVDEALANLLYGLRSLMDKIADYVQEKLTPK